MSPRASDSVDRQQAYYDDTAGNYDASHRAAHSEHDTALSLLAGFIRSLGYGSVLDVGTGTGRAMQHLRGEFPESMRIVGVEPVESLRAVAVEHGVPEGDIVAGSGLALPFEDDAFDVVCEFGVLHHVPEPARMVGEMLRVARRAVFISDSNNFGQGSPLVRRVKQSLHRAGLWPLFDFIRTRGKGYMVSEGDGLFYSYSVFDNLAQLQASCQRVHLMNTMGKGGDLYRESGHVAVMAIK